jgi:hypothetical protein
MKTATGDTMHPFLQGQLAALHNEDLKAAAARDRRGAAASGAVRRGSGRAPADVVIRRTTSSDGPALAALAALDAAPLPLGPSILAEVAGVPRAVLPLDGGPSFADPFAPTDELVALLELRADQIHRDEKPARHPLRHVWASAAALRRLV